MKLDRIDLDILDALQKDATRSTTELAARVGLSQSPCWRRVNLLQSAGVIKRRVASVPEVIPCFVLRGDIDFILRVATRTTELPIGELHG